MKTYRITVTDTYGEAFAVTLHAADKQSALDCLILDEGWYVTQTEEVSA